MTHALPLSERLLRAGTRPLLGVSPGLLTRLAGGTKRSPRGYSLDAQTQLILELERLLGFPRTETLPVPAARAQSRRSVRLVGPLPLSVFRVQDRTVDTPAGPLPARIYTPRERSGPAPALLYLHGGGFTVCDLDTHDTFCRELAVKADLTVISLDYRLGPEHRFPAAVDDALAAYAWLTAQADALGLDRSRLAIGGDSAGGNLAAVVCQQAALGRGPMPCFQLLIYPALEMVERSASRREFADGFFLTQPLMDWFLDQYFAPGTPRDDVRASPARFLSLKGQPPAHVVTAGFDPLLDEGEAYAKRLEADGVRVTYQFESSLIHGFLQMGGAVDAAAVATDRICRHVRTALHD